LWEEVVEVGRPGVKTIEAACCNPDPYIREGNGSRDAASSTRGASDVGGGKAKLYLAPLVGS